MNTRKHDLVLWGATGFTGTLVAEYLAAAQTGLSLALGGRSEKKLLALREAVAKKEPAFANVPIVIGDASDPASLRKLAENTRVILSTVGPYWEHGKELARAAALSGTDYCDLTGETTFWRWLLDNVEADAKRTGARLVPSAGFDSIPSDLGVKMLADYARDQHGKKLAQTRLVMLRSKGGVSGGTLASALGIADLARKDPSVRKLLRDPYALSPHRAHELANDGPDPMSVRHDTEFDVWTAPFVMGAINTRVVRRSNALLNHAYGTGFSYAEWMSFGPGARGYATAVAANVALVAFLGAAVLPPTRALLQRMLPGSGEGPSESVRNSGFFKIAIVARMEGGGPLLVARVEGKKDPGYGETAKMISETAIALASTKGEGGVWTTATALGDNLLDRLQKAGMTFLVEERESASM